MVDSSNGRAPGSTRLGEVIETSTVRLWVESDHLHELPPLGSLVQVACSPDDVIFAVVGLGQTAGIDATRRAIRRGSDEVRDAEVYRRHPELSQILRTTFEALPVAYRRGERIIRMLPPLPPPLHYSVETVAQEALFALTGDPRYLTIVATASGAIPTEQLIAAHVRQIYEARGFDALWLDRAAHEIAQIFKDDYDRLLPLLEAIEPAL